MTFFTLSSATTESIAQRRPEENFPVPLELFPLFIVSPVVVVVGGGGCCHSGGFCPCSLFGIIFVILPFPPSLQEKVFPLLSTSLRSDNDIAICDSIAANPIKRQTSSKHRLDINPIFQHQSLSSSCKPISQCPTPLAPTLLCDHIRQKSALSLPSYPSLATLKFDNNPLFNHFCLRSHISRRRHRRRRRRPRFLSF